MEAGRCGAAVHAYVLMSNYVHLLLTPIEAGAVARMMRCLGRQCVPYVNTRYGRSGTLWEGRYKSCLVDGKRYLGAGQTWACHRRAAAAVRHGSGRASPEFGKSTLTPDFWADWLQAAGPSK